MPTNVIAVFKLTKYFLHYPNEPCMKKSLCPPGKAAVKRFLSFHLFGLSLIIFVSSCGPGNSAKSDPVLSPSEIMKNMMSFSYYKSDYLKLSEDFTAFNANKEQITTSQFFKLISTGDYLPLRLKIKDSIVYRLCPIARPANKDIRSYLRQIGKTELEHYQMEGKSLPPYQFTDLDGQVYTPENTKGKILAINTWFIHCQACNEEMPDLNQLVKKYKNRKDILFVSLAFDAREALKTFLIKKQFDYAVVPVDTSYIEHQLKLNAYPTHLVINKNGLIKKVMNDPGELAIVLAKEAAKP